MSEPCPRCERYGDMTASFIAQTRALVAVEAERDAAVGALARVRVELAGLESEGQGFVSLSTIRAALEPTQPKGKP